MAKDRWSLWQEHNEWEGETWQVALREDAAPHTIALLRTFLQGLPPEEAESYSLEEGVSPERIAALEAELGGPCTCFDGVEGEDYDDVACPHSTYLPGFQRVEEDLLASRETPLTVEDCYKLGWLQ